MMRGERIRRPYAVFVRRRRRGGTPAEADDETAEIPVAADDGPAAAEEGRSPGFGVTPDARVGECGTGYSSPVLQRSQVALVDLVRGLALNEPGFLRACVVHFHATGTHDMRPHSSFMHDA